MPISRTNVWQNVADVTLGSANATLDTGTITSFNFYKVLFYVPSTSSSGLIQLRLNSDTGTNYFYSVMQNGGASSNNGSISRIELTVTAGTGVRYGTLEISNFSSTIPKFVSASISEGATPNQCITTGYWNNTANLITSIQIIASAGTLASGSRIIVYGSN